MVDRFMKKCLASVIIRKIQIRTKMIYYSTLVSIAITKKIDTQKCWQGGREKEFLKIVNGNVNCYSHCETSVEETSAIFIEALSTIPKLWDKQKCPSVDEWMKKTWYIYTVEYESS
jgi:hypothetical protein